MRKKGIKKIKDGFITLPNKKFLISYNEFIHDFGRNITRSSMYTLTSGNPTKILKALKHYVSGTSILNIQLRTIYKNLDKSNPGASTSYQYYNPPSPEDTMMTRTHDYL